MSWLSAVGVYLTKAIRLMDIRGPFEPTHWVWSQGLALMCDHHGGRSFVRDQRSGPAIRFAANAYDDVQEGDLVWVRQIALPQFVDEALPRIQARFALVSGDEDWSMPSDFERSSEILANPNVVCWFSQNCDGQDPSGKMLPLPIGLDFHTISQRRRWGHKMATPREQEQELDELRRVMPPNTKRLLRVHADFHFNKHSRVFGGETRDSVEETLRTKPCLKFQQKKIPRLDLWREKTRYAFCVSPHGNGLDCHRTWESLALGNIVIHKRSPIDSLFEGLPVVIVNGWDEITEANLLRWHAQYAGSFNEPGVLKRLTNQYWIDQIRRVLTERLRLQASSV